MRVSKVLSLVLGAVSILAFAFGCGGPSSPPGSSGSTVEIPELTDELIYERINDAWIREVPEESGTSKPISWNFDPDEPKEITVVEKQLNGLRATLILDIKTSSAPGARANRELAGRIRTEWELRTGWVLRRWEIVKTENISMKYKDLPATQPAQNSNDNEANGSVSGNQTNR